MAFQCPCPYEQMDTLSRSRQPVAEAHIYQNTGSPSQRLRIEGFDLARAVAVMAMVLVNYKAYMQVGTLSPLWLNTLVDFIFGRAATVFVILAGVSVSLIFKRPSVPDGTDGSRRYLLVRSLLLLVTGVALWRWWAAEILHFYALYIALGAWVASWSGRRLWVLTAAVGLVSLPVCAELTITYDLVDHLAFLDGRGLGLRLAADYLVSNYYPFFPWFGYFLVGMLLGRREPTGLFFHRRLLFIGVIVCTAVELVSAGALAWAARHDIEVQGHWGLTFLRSDAFPATPLFVISSAASGLAVIGLCRLAAVRMGGSLYFKPLYFFGKLSLTMYVGHLLWGLGFVFWVNAHGGRVGQIAMLASVGGFCVVGMCFAAIWCRYFNKGPLETLFYRIARFKWTKASRMAALPET
jgi:uncharacterized membrane protein YeiB